MTNDLSELMQKQEPLNPLLRPYVVEGGPLGRMIKHPLINEIMYLEQLNALINARYKIKTEAVAEAIQKKKWGQAIAVYERPWRIDILLKHRHDMSDQDYWECVGEIWIDSENNWQCYENWRSLWECPRFGKRFVMRDVERRHLAKLPDSIIVYRGIHGLGVTKQRNRTGLSWTTDRAVAERFARAYNQHPKIILQGIVQKSDVHAFFSSRSESEIVSSKVVKIVRNPI